MNLRSRYNFLIAAMCFKAAVSKRRSDSPPKMDFLRQRRRGGTKSLFRHVGYAVSGQSRINWTQ